MSGETYKLLAGILALEEFTNAQLAEATGVNPHTVNSWLRRSNKAGRYVADGGTHDSAARGRPRKIWQLREEDAEDIRRELASLAGLPQTERDLSDTDDAQQAFEDPDIRSDIYHHISRAEQAVSEIEREGALAKAQKWYDFETERLGAWEASGYTPPREVAEEMSRLQRRIQGLRFHMERLGNMAFRGVDGFAEWFEEAIDRWFDDDTPSDRAFDPLITVGFDAQHKQQGLQSALHIILATSEECSIISQDYLICGLIMAMARVRSSEAYMAIADVLEDLGYEIVGDALNVRLKAAHDNDSTHRFIHQALVGLAENPAMLQNQTIGAWADGLLSHRLYKSHLCLSLLQCLDRREQVDIRRLAREKHAELTSLRHAIVNEAEVWRDMNRGLARNHEEEVLTQLDRMLDLSRAVPDERVQFSSASAEGSGTRSNGVADFFQAFFSPGEYDYAGT